MSDNTPEAEEPREDSALFGEPSEEPSEPVTEPAAEPEASTEVEPAAGIPDPGEPADAPPETDGTNGGPGRDPLPLILLGVLVALILLVGWTKVVGTTSFCTSCHTTRAAAATAAHSAHAQVSCVSCHRGYGVKGAVAYIPTFFRELVDQLTPLPVAKGVMDSAVCSDCHGTIFTSPLLAGEHPSTGCPACHGDPSHPKPLPAAISPFNPHPTTWVQLHGDAALKSTETCATCHPPDFCMETCHFKFEQQFPHSDDWITVHGTAEIEQGPEACTLCHPTTFCASCHGTEIPHAPEWLSRHYIQLGSGYPTTPCLLCHAPTDCDNCHARHGIHNSQTIYAR